MLQNLPNLIRNKVLKCCFGGFCFKKKFISKLKNITTVASVRTANLTRVRITMASPMQSGAGVLLPCFYSFINLVFTQTESTCPAIGIFKMLNRISFNSCFVC